MSKSLFTMAFLFISIYLFGQNDSAEIKMHSEYGSNNNEITNLLLFQNIDYFRVKFTGRDLKNKYFTVIAKEIWDGNLKKTDTLINSKTNKKMEAIDRDTLTLTVFGSRADNNKLKLFFRFPMVGMARRYDAINSDDYTLRDIGSNIQIKKNKFFPAFVYILPYIEGNSKVYCAVDKCGINVENWGKQFELKHYIIFEMKFED